MADKKEKEETSGSFIDRTIDSFIKAISDSGSAGEAQTAKVKRQRELMEDTKPKGNKK